MKPLLVDSSAWIQAFSRKPEKKLQNILRDAKDAHRLSTCGIIFLEVVRGGRTPREYEELQEEFHSMHWLSTEEEHWSMATDMGFQLAKKGFRPPSTDLLIASLAISTDCELLHCDRHFDQIAQFFPLRIVSSL